MSSYRDQEETAYTYQNNIIIIAGGASVSEYDLTGLDDIGYVIGVNDSFLNYKGCNCGLTMDRVWMEARIDMVLKKKKPFFVRQSAVKFINEKADSDFIRLYDCLETHELSHDPGKLNGTSSGMCALNLAIQLKPDFVYLLGFDMNGGRWYQYDFKNWEPKGDKFNKWINQFREISKKHTNIINVNHKSALNCFPSMSYEKFRASFR